MGDIRIPGMTYGCGLSFEQRDEIEHKIPTDRILAGAEAATGRPGEAIGHVASAPTHRDVVRAQRDEEGPITVGHGFSAAVTTAEIFAPYLEDAAPKLLASVELAGAAYDIYETAKSLPEAWKKGDEQRDAHYRDGRFMGLAFALKGLPSSYVVDEMKKRPDVLGTSKGPASQICEKLMNDRDAMVVLQLRADEGMKVADQVIQRTETREAYFQRNPDMARRYNDDAAFHIGFDAMMHAHAQGGAVEVETRRALVERDAREQITMIYAG